MGRGVVLKFRTFPDEGRGNLSLHLNAVVQTPTSTNYYPGVNFPGVNCPGLKSKFYLDFF